MGEHYTLLKLTGNEMTTSKSPALVPDLVPLKSVGALEFISVSTGSSPRLGSSTDGLPASKRKLKQKQITKARSVIRSNSYFRLDDESI